MIGRRMLPSVLLGLFVARKRRAEVSFRAAAFAGPRPVDHIKGLKKLNCQVEISNGYIHVDAQTMRGGREVAGATVLSPAPPTS